MTLSIKKLLVALFLLCLAVPVLPQTAPVGMVVWTAGQVLRSTDLNGTISALAATITGKLDVANGVFRVADTATLNSLSTSLAPTILRVDYAVGNGAPPQVFVASAAACSLNGGIGDGGSQVFSADGKCWLGRFTEGRGDVRAWGAQCSQGATWSSPPDATGFLQAAANYFASRNGGIVVVPCPIQVSGTVTLTGLVRVAGVGPIYYPGMLDTSSTGAAVAPTWPPAAGPAINCSSASAPCFLVAGIGVEIDHINFGNIQPTPPSSGSWSPATYGWIIGTSGTWNGLHLHHLTFTSADKCIDLEGSQNYGTNGIAGAQWTVSDIWANPCLQDGIRIAYADNTGRISNIDYDFWWYRNNSVVGAYVEQNSIGFDLCYAANTQVNNVEFAYNWKAIRVTSCTVSGGFGHTSGAENLQLANVSFNEVCQGVALDDTSGNAELTGVMTNVLAYTDSSSRCSTWSGSNPIFFDFSSNNAQFSLSHVHAGAIDTLAAIGHGSGGTLTIDDVNVDAYSAYTAGRNAFMVSAGAAFYLGGSPIENVRPASGAGAMVGPGKDGTQGCAQPIQIGGGSGISPSMDGAAQLSGSCQGGDRTRSGYVGLFMPSGARAGYMGYADGTGINVESDTGKVYLKPNPGSYSGSSPYVVIGTDGTKLQIQVQPLPTSCTGLATGTLWDNANVVQVCP